ncbi:hypothetical protein B6N60_05048 [Richelia sinica FACHB-800]|uniref:Uncharacterized protein n=1 Tax=Richelia sinica FACHB-800 TaxID=1357546 RepID=A0A975TCT4_9NOST|nr:hypothetical protein B6N60_05048 [Richelia sinica FACHB-800]
MLARAEITQLISLPPIVGVISRHQTCTISIPLLKLCELST